MHPWDIEGKAYREGNIWHVRNMCSTVTQAGTLLCFALFVLFSNHFRAQGRETGNEIEHSVQ